MEETATEVSDTPAEESPTEGSQPDTNLAAEVEKWKALTRKHEERAKANAKAAKELEQLRESTASESEKAIAAAKAEGRTEALAVATRRILTAEVKAAAGGVLQDPEDAVRLLDLAEFEVDDDGEIDAKAITAAVRRLAESKPYLAVGAKPTALPGGGATPSQGISMDDLIREKARGH